MRDSTIFYRSFYEAIKELPEVNQLEIYNAIFEHSLNGITPKLNGLSKTIYILIEPQVEANLKRFIDGKKGGEHGKKGGRPPKVKPQENPTGDIKENPIETPNNNNNVNNNVNKNGNDNENLNKKTATDIEIKFEKFWGYYKKGSKKVSKEKFFKLSDNDLEKIKIHLPKYFKANPEVKFRKDAERYLSNRLWENEDEETLIALSNNAPIDKNIFITPNHVHR